MLADALLFRWYGCVGCVLLIIEQIVGCGGVDGVNTVVAVNSRVGLMEWSFVIELLGLRVDTGLSVAPVNWVDWDADVCCALSVFIVI